MPIRILTVDDHPLLREGIAAVIEGQPDMQLVGEAASGLEALQVFRDCRPDVTLMDLQMPGMGGVEAIGALHREFPQAKVVVLTTYQGDAQALRAFKAGAAGYLLKSMLRREPVDTIRSVHAGRRRMPPEIAAGIAEHASDDALSQREIEVLRLVARGHTLEEVARTLSLSRHTVRTFVRRLYAKLQVTTRAQAVREGLRQGLL